MADDQKGAEEEVPVYSALPPDGSKCICGEDAHAVVVMQREVKVCETCGTEKVTTQEVHLCDLHNDLRMQGVIDGRLLLVAAIAHQSGALSADEHKDTVAMLFGSPDIETAERVFASDQSGVRMLDDSERKRATKQLRDSLKAPEAK